MTHLLTVPIALAILIAGCGNGLNPTGESFEAAINKYYKSKGRLCTTLKYDLKVSGLALRESYPHANVHQLQALEKVGLLTSVEDGVTGSYEKEERTKQFSLTESGKQFIKLPEEYGKPMSPFVKPQLCWGTATVDKVLSWRPVPYGDKGEHGQDHFAVFTYKLDVPAWAKSAEVRNAFVEIDKWADGEGTQEIRHHLEATKEGWVDIGLPLM